MAIHLAKYAAPRPPLPVGEAKSYLNLTNEATASAAMPSPRPVKPNFSVVVAPGRYENIKITTPEDLVLAEHFLEELQQEEHKYGE